MRLRFNSMNIFVDESGSFPITSALSSWCVIAAYVSPEGDRSNLEELVLSLRQRSPSHKSEIKLGDLPEPQYFDFLRALGNLHGIAFASATDMSLNSKEVITHHRNTQADKVIEHREKMVHESMRVSLTQLSDSIRAVPVNLYAQLVFQIKLFHEVATRSTLYFVQRSPQTLREFRWRIDQKDVVVTEYEKTFRNMLPAILQSMSIESPFLMLEGADYSHMSQYEFPPGETPTYLADVYGLPKAEGFNLKEMIGGNFQFVDSKKVLGIQVADLLASGIRRLLKGEFSDNEMAARLLGALTVQAVKKSFPLTFVTMGAEQVVSPELAKRLKLVRQPTADGQMRSTGISQGVRVLCATYESDL